MGIDDVPRKFTRQVYLHFQSTRLQPEQLEQVQTLVGAHRGRCPLFLCFKTPEGKRVYLEANERFAVNPSRDLQTAADAQFGPGTYQPKVDASVPERAPRRWERQVESAGGE